MEGKNRNRVEEMKSFARRFALKLPSTSSKPQQNKAIPNVEDKLCTTAPLESYRITPAQFEELHFAIAEEFPEIIGSDFNRTLPFPERPLDEHRVVKYFKELQQWNAERVCRFTENYILDNFTEKDVYSDEEEGEDEAMSELRLQQLRVNYSGGIANRPSTTVETAISTERAVRVEQENVDEKLERTIEKEEEDHERSAPEAAVHVSAVSSSEQVRGVEHQQQQQPSQMAVWTPETSAEFQLGVVMVQPQTAYSFGPPGGQWTAGPQFLSHWGTLSPPVPPFFTAAAGTMGMGVNVNETARCQVAMPRPGHVVLPRHSLPRHVQHQQQAHRFSQHHQQQWISRPPRAQQFQSQRSASFYAYGQHQRAGSAIYRSQSGPAINSPQPRLEKALFERLKRANLMRHPTESAAIREALATKSEFEVCQMTVEAIEELGLHVTLAAKIHSAVR